MEKPETSHVNIQYTNHSEIVLLVAEFLEMEGCYDVVQVLLNESNEQDSSKDLSDCPGTLCNEFTSTKRTQIRRLLFEGNVLGAISKINELNPDILDEHEEVMFHLLVQQLVELIRIGAVKDAIIFAQEELAPIAQHKEKFTHHLEELMLLFLFDNPLEDAPNRYLFSTEHRIQLFQKVNTVILETLSLPEGSRLHQLTSSIAMVQYSLFQKQIPWNLLFTINGSIPIGDKIQSMSNSDAKQDVSLLTLLPDPDTTNSNDNGITDNSNDGDILISVENSSDVIIE